MLYLITGVGLVLFVCAVAGLILLVRSGQFDDLDTPAHRALGDDPEIATPPPAPLPLGIAPASAGRPHDRAAAKADR